MQGSRLATVGKSEAQQDYPVIDSLTARELEVMLLVFNGLTNNDIGQKLGISPRTVEIHRCGALKRLRVSNSFLAMRTFLRAGFLSKILEEI